VLREKALREKALLQHEDAQEKHEGKLQLSKPRVHLSMSRRLNASSVLNRTSRRNGGGWYKRVASWSELISVNQQPARSESTIGQSPGWSPGRRLGGGSDGLKRSECAIRACAEITIYKVSRQRLLMTAGTLPLLMTALAFSHRYGANGRGYGRFSLSLDSHEQDNGVSESNDLGLAQEELSNVRRRALLPKGSARWT